MYGRLGGPPFAKHGTYLTSVARDDMLYDKAKGIGRTVLAQSAVNQECAREHGLVLNIN